MAGDHVSKKNAEFWVCVEEQVFVREDNNSAVEAWGGGGDLARIVTAFYTSFDSPKHHNSTSNFCSTLSASEPYLAQTNICVNGFSYDEKYNFL